LAREVALFWCDMAWRGKVQKMRKRYVNVLLGLGPVALGLVIGWFIPIGQGSAVVFGGVIGITIGYLLVYSRPGKQMQLWFSSSTESKEQHLAGDIEQRVIDINTHSAKEAAILDQQRFEQLHRRW
jgi:hypothetical protein